MGSRLYSFKIHVFFYFSGFLFALLFYFCFPFCCQLVASFIYFQKFELIGFQNTRRRRDQWVSFVPHQALIPASPHPQSLPSFLFHSTQRLRQANCAWARHPMSMPQPSAHWIESSSARSSILQLGPGASCQLSTSARSTDTCEMRYAMHGESPTAAIAAASVAISIKAQQAKGWPKDYI